MKLHQLLENKQQIEQALQQVQIEGDYEITPNGVDVHGSVIIPPSLTQIPVQFNIITGGFVCSYTKITSLKGAPIEVGDVFDCSYTKITSLKGAPREVGGNFACVGTKITSLKGAPREVGGNFACIGTKITSLEGAPREVGGNFVCSLTNITSLKGAPREVGGNFVCVGTNIRGKPDTSDIDIGGDVRYK